MFAQWCEFISIPAPLRGAGLARLMQALGCKKRQMMVVVFFFLPSPVPPLAIILLHRVRDKSTSGESDLP